MAKRRTTTDAADILERRYFTGKRVKLALLEEERANAAIGRGIFDLRKKAGMTQGQLAKLVGTTTSAISRLEAADYRGHSLSMLRRVAAALGQRVNVRFVPVLRKKRAA